MLYLIPEMKKTLTLLILIAILGCEKSYEKEEFIAVQDVLNDYLKREYLDNILFPNRMFPEKDIEPIDTNNIVLKIYISDALNPIEQIREDNYWMFENNYPESENNEIFNSILKSEKFKNLSYREIEKNDLELIKPYKQVKSSKIILKEKEKYNLLQFSRICFDSSLKNGIVVIDEHIGQKGMKIQGYHKAFLIKKIKGKWKYIKE